MFGRKKVKEETRMVNFRITLSQYEALKIYCFKAGLTASKAFREFIKDLTGVK